MVTFGLNNKRNEMIETNVAGWRRGFAEKSDTTFPDGFADDVVLEASVLAKPIKGKALVAATLAMASSMYGSLEFTAETTVIPPVTCNGVRPPSAVSRSRASPCSNAAPTAGSSRLPSTTGLSMSSLGSRPRFATGSPALSRPTISWMPI
jgi:hypothetical protein